MTITYESVLTDDDIQYILDQQPVYDARQVINTKETGSVYFTLPLPSSIKKKLYDSLGLDLSTVSSIPMRWIKGDTKPHVDRGRSDFENTYLVYLNDSPGQFVLGEESYPITKGSAFVFSEGLNHETVDTGSEPRLLLGPMSEQGFAVGSSINVEQGATVYFRQVSGIIQYSTDNQDSWISVGNNYPININNSTESPTEVAKVEFITDITFDDTGGNGTSKYFGCSSSHIQFGSSSLKSDGTRPVIIIDGITGYPGLIQNGSSEGIGRQDIYVYNLKISNIDSTLADGGGWIGQEYFGKSAINNYILNCVSDGGIPLNGGGIVGQYAAYKTTDNSSLTILGCSSTGSIGTSAGGIAGKNAGNNGTSATVNLTIEQCFSEGAIGSSAGGIVGESAGNVTCTKCYSKGNIDNAGGGIFGRFGGAGENNSAVAENCYSEGDVGAGAGGIFGREAGRDSSDPPKGSVAATNCYTTGNIDTTVNTGRGGGIFGREYANQTVLNCYVSGTTTEPRGYILADSTVQPSTTYSEAKNGGSGWDSTNADSVLNGDPIDGVGDTWASTGTNTPYELANFGATPYQRQSISGTTLVQSYSQTVTVGESSSQAVKINTDPSGNDFTIIKKSGGDSASRATITMDSQTGKISTTSATVVGTYTITVRSIGSYFITSFTLIVTEATASATTAEEVSCCSRPLVVKDADYTTLNNLIAGNIMIGSTARPRQPISYRDLYNKKMAYASKQ